MGVGPVIPPTLLDQMSSKSQYTLGTTAPDGVKAAF